MRKKLTQNDIPDLSGKIVVVTGANSGLGFDSAKTLAGKGATVVMAVRNLDKGETAMADLLKDHPDASLDLMKLDVGNLSASGFDTIANTSHPGLVLGHLQANSVEQSCTKTEAILYRIIQPLLAQDVSMGVLPMLYGMTATDARGGVFYGPRTFNLRGYPAEKIANKEANDAAALKRF
jgi:hypothetical protein